MLPVCMEAAALEGLGWSLSNWPGDQGESSAFWITHCMFCGHKKCWSHLRQILTQWHRISVDKGVF